MSLPSVNKPASVDLNKTSDPANEPNNTNESNQPTVAKPRERPRFTRGEKCLCTHLGVTFGVLLLLFILYCVHLGVVKHHGDNMFSGWLRAGPALETEMTLEKPYCKYISAKRYSERNNSIRVFYMSQDHHPPIAKEPSPPIGMVYVLPKTDMCNSLLLRTKWSLAPAHCVAARSNPDLAYALPNWRIMYAINGNDDAEQYVETRIQRSVPHPHFNRDDFQNNIGLFEHAYSINLFSYANLNEVSMNPETLMANADNLKLIGWEESRHLHGRVVENPVQPFAMEKCKLYVAPVVDLRENEYCVTLKTKRNVSITPGAILTMKSQYVGLFSWGESAGRRVPFVILDLATYKNWIIHIISI